jgi:hypothetical protein
MECLYKELFVNLSGVINLFCRIEAEAGSAEEQPARNKSGG